VERNDTSVSEKNIGGDMGFKIKSVLDCNQAILEPDIFKMEIICEEGKNAKPGQFVMIKPKTSSVMPRPFSIFQYENSKLSIMFRVVGENTKLLSLARNGHKLAVSSPLGKPIPISKKEKNYILVAGGMGMAGLFFLASKLKSQGKNVVALVGNKKHVGIYDEWYFYHLNECGCKIFSISETGGKINGLVTDLLRQHLKKFKNKATIISCGPKPMLKAVAEIAEKNGNKCLVVLEEIMACGVGSCKSCAVFGKDGSVKHVCTDGPAFDARWIDWEKFVPKIASSVILCGKKRASSMSMKMQPHRDSSLTLEYPSMNASGCLDIDAIENGHVDITHIGALVTKGITLKPRLGNPVPRVCEISEGMINSIGLENVGIKKFKKEQLPKWLKLKKPVIANISGFSIEEYAEVASQLKNTGISGIEINISCPNIKQDGTIFGLHPEKTLEIVKAVRKEVPEIFLITKLSPMANDCVVIANAAIEGGTDAISLINTPLGMSIDVYSRKVRIANKMGGMSGQAIKPLAIRIVHQIAQKIFVPIIGMGGINSGEDALEFILAGANCFAVGTGLFKNPDIFSKINSDLEKFLEYHQVNHIQDLVGRVAE
jgi:dihydroorotate dehydrogenase (NAD+) catalytic subunit